jgi:hypothetical protein
LRLAAARRDRIVQLDVRWFGLGWKVNADLPNPTAFDAASRYVTPDDVSAGIACGPDVQAHVDAVKPYLDVGFDEVALVQIGADIQADFCAWAEQELLPALHNI